MRKLSIKKIVIYFFSILLLLFGVLVIHIYLVTKPCNNHEVMRQLSRIDFKQEIDSTEANKIRSFVGHLDGVQSTHFNVPDHVLVYTYVVGKQTSLNVYNQLMDFGHYKAERYIVDAATAKTGCPAMDNNSFSYRLSSYVSKLFN